MHQPNSPQASPMAKAINGFATGMAFIGAIFLLPFFFGDLREIAFDILSQTMDVGLSGIAYAASWGVAILITITFVSAITALIQAVFQLIFRIGGQRGGF